MSGVLNVITTLGSIGNFGSVAPLRIGNMTLAGMEVPSLLRRGGEQQVVCTWLPGGARTIQSMGDNPSRLTLAGMFVGPNALPRAEQMMAMRIAGAPVQFSVSRISATVVITQFEYSLRDKGALCPYELVLEILPSLSAAIGSVSSLSSLVGSDLAKSITSISATIGNVSQAAQTMIAQTQTIIGQVTPLASLVGLGGPLAKVSDSLQTANVLAQDGTNFANIPSVAANLAVNLQTASGALMDTISQTGGSLAGISAAAPVGSLVSDGPSLLAATGQAGALAGAVQTGALVNRAVGNAVLAGSSATLPVPAIHA